MSHLSSPTSALILGAVLMLGALGCDETSSTENGGSLDGSAGQADGGAVQGDQGAVQGDQGTPREDQGTVQGDQGIAQGDAATMPPSDDGGTGLPDALVLMDGGDGDGGVPLPNGCGAEPAPAADRQAGVCAGSVKVCNDQGEWVEPDYSSIPRYEAEENSCDQVDNDCDGQTDEANCAPTVCRPLTVDDNGLVNGEQAPVAGLSPDALAYRLTGAEQVTINLAQLGLDDLDDASAVAFWVKLTADESQSMLRVRAGRSEGHFETAPERTDEIWYSMEARLGDSADGQVFEAGAWGHIVLHFNRRLGIQTFTNGRPSLIYRVRSPVEAMAVNELIFAAQGGDGTVEISNIQVCSGRLNRPRVLDMVSEVTRDNAELSPQRLRASLAQIQGHLSGDQPLNPVEQGALVDALSETMFHLEDRALAAQAAELVEAFESQEGPFFVAPKGDFSRADVSEFEWAMYRLQQGILDYGFAHNDLPFPPTDFGTAAYFPGAVGPDVPREMAVTVPVQATNLLPRAYHVHQDAKHRVQMTGLYVPPGETVTIRAPANAIGRGIEVRVGIHDEQYDIWPTQQRFPRVLTRFDLDQERIDVANPFGGALLFLIPVGLDLGLVEFTVSQAVYAPRFFRNDVMQTDLDTWLASRQLDVPWAQMVGHNFMFSLPTSMLRELADPTPVLEAWDLAMDGYMAMFDRPLTRHRAEYFISDVRNPAGSFGPGYPTIMGGYSPNIDDAGWNPLNIIDPTKVSPSVSQLFIVLHEYGHQHFFPTLPGETEVNVNLPATYIYHQQLGYTFEDTAPTPIDGAFMQSIHQQLTRDEAAVNWMITRNFGDGEPMGIDVDHPDRYDQKSYQSRGFAKYVDFAALFGWAALAGAYTPYVEHDLRTGEVTLGIEPEGFILNASASAGFNTLPLFHFWGVVVPSEQLRAGNAEHPSSPELLQRLLAYRALIPADQAAFDAHFQTISDTVVDSWTEFYDIRRLSYDRAAGQRATRHLDCLIESYYPEADVNCN